MLRFGLAALLVALLAVACNGGDGDAVTLEDYFREFDRVADEAEAAGEAIGTPDISSGSFEASRDSLATYYDDYATATEDIIEKFEALEPPEEASGEHRAFVSAIQDLPSITYNYADRLRDAETEEEFRAAFMDTAEGEAAGARVGEACKALQALADADEIDVDLECES